MSAPPEPRAAGGSPAPGKAPFLPPAPPLAESAAVPPGPEWVRTFDEDLAADRAFEAKLFTREIVILVTLVLLAILREMLL